MLYKGLPGSRGSVPSRGCALLAAFRRTNGMHLCVSGAHSMMFFRGVTMIMMIHDLLRCMIRAGGDGLAVATRNTSTTASPLSGRGEHVDISGVHRTPLALPSQRVCNPRSGAGSTAQALL